MEKIPVEMLFAMIGEREVELALLKQQVFVLKQELTAKIVPPEPLKPGSDV